jgi:hypothetical protein
VGVRSRRGRGGMLRGVIDVGGELVCRFHTGEGVWGWHRFLVSGSWIERQVDGYKQSNKRDLLLF